MAIQWLTVNEAAQILGISADTVRRRARRGMLDSRKKAGRMQVRIPVPGEDQPDSLAATQSNSDNDTTQSAATEATQPESATGAQAAESQDAAVNENSTQQRFTPGDLFKPPDSGEPEDELRRYQRLAGASVILAQRQADTASEQVVLARSELNRLRRICLTSWAGGAVALGLCLLVILILGVRASSANAQLAVQQQRVSEARHEVQRLGQSLDLLENQLQSRITETSARAD